MTSSQNISGRSHRPVSRNRRITDLPHNPYIGFFHRNYRLSSAVQNRVYLPNSSPHVGTFRHAPAHSQRLKDLMWEDDTSVTPFISQLQLTKQNKYADRHIAKQALDEIPMSTFTSKSVINEEDPPMCLICLDGFVDGDEIRNLKCSHVFHRACVDIWLLGTLSDDSVYTSICPTCRQDAGSTSSSSSQCGTSEGCGGSGIPTEIYLRIGQHLLEEGVRGVGGTPSPLIMSPLTSPPLPSPPVPEGGGRYSPRLTQQSLSESDRATVSPPRARSASVSSLSSTSTTRSNNDPPVSPSCSCISTGSCCDVGEVDLSFAMISYTEAMCMSMLDLACDVEDNQEEAGSCAD